MSYIFDCQIVAVILCQQLFLINHVQMDVIKGSDLKLLLKKKGITSNYLSDTLGIHKTSISRYFTDDIAMPATFILKVAKLAGLQMSDLVKGDGPSVHIVSEPSVVYERTPKKEPIPSVDGLAIGEYIMMIEKRLLAVEQSLKDMQNKRDRVMELELV